MNKLTSTQANLTQLDKQEEISPDTTSTEQEEASTKRLDRRGVLQMGGAAALAGTAAALMSAAPAAAATGVMHFGATNGAGQSGTYLTSSNSKFTFHSRNAGLGHGIWGEANNPDGSGYGVLGTGDGGAGVVGGTRGDGPGMRAYVQPGAGGSALQAVTLEPNNSEPTVMVLQGGLGHGVYSHIENAKSARRAVYGRTVGTGHAVVASVVNAQSPAAATRTTTQGSGPGLAALSAKGVGATFSGKTAQVQLVPSSDSGHPVSGAAGQLFVDSFKHLWYCRGGHDWQRLA